MPPPPPPVTVETLLEERPWVRRLACALAADPASADDLEQDAWVAALKRPPSGAGSIRTWFRRVVHNRVYESHRREARRSRREEAAARPEAVASTQEIVARAEAHRAVVEAVFSLTEPDRTTVVLRFFEDLETSAIAARMGVPADTVRSRLRRAIVALRARLRPRDERSVPAWVLLVGAPGAVFPHAPPLPVGSGGLAVSTSATKSVAAAAVVLLLAGFVAWTFVSTGDDPGHDTAGLTTPVATDTPADAADAAAADAAARRASRAGEVRPGASATSHADTGTVLVGDVRFVQGDRAAAEVTVTLRSASGASTITTDVRGGFRFDGVPPDGAVSVAAEAEGLATARATGLRLRRGETRRVPTLWLDAPVGVRVDVVDPVGAPVAGAAVEAYPARGTVAREDWEARAPEPHATAKTDARGRATLDGLPVGEWLFRATADGFAPGGSDRLAVLRGGVEVSIRLRLEQGFELAGTITAVDGSPVDGALVLAVPPVEADELMIPSPTDPRRVETRTDDQGRYRFPALRAGEHSLALARPGSLPARLGVVSIPSVSRFDAKLDGGVLTGRVADADGGRPLAGARIRAAVWRRHSPTFLTATSDAEGRYRIDVPLGGVLQGPARGEGEARSLPVHFDVELEGYVYAPDVNPTPWRMHWVFGGDTTSFDIAMRRAASLTGTVSGPDGPVGGAEVTADVWNPLRGSITSRTTTAEDGTYRFPGLPAGRARIVVARRGFVQPVSPGEGWRSAAKPDPATVVEIPASGTVTFDVALLAGAAIAGRVLDDAGAPVAAARVEIADGDLRLDTTTGADGSFALSGLRRETDTKLVARADGFIDGEAAARVGADGAAHPVEIVLARLGSVRGRVVGPAGDGVAGAWVQVAPAKDALDGAYEIVSVWQRAARHPVARDGTFDAPIAWSGGRAAEGIVVRAGATGLAPAVSARLDAPRGGVADAGTLRLEAGHRLEGRVVAADGSGPVAGAEVEFQNERLPPALGQRRDWSGVGRDSMPFEFVARTDADGRFAVDGLPPWRYELRVNGDGFTGAAPTVAVPQEGELVVELPRMLGIAGRVEYEDGSAAGGTIVIAHWTDGRPGVGGFVEARADGTFHLTRLEAGRYVLEARRAWDRTDEILPARSEAVETGTRDAKVVVKRGGGSVSGICTTPAGAAVPGAVVHFRAASGGPLVHARSGPDGRFTATSLVGDGPWQVTAEGTRSVGGPEGYGRNLVAQAADVRTGTTGLRLEFRDSAPISGRIEREDGSSPAGRLFVQARRGADGPWTTYGNVQADGAFRIDNATEGAWTLAVVDADTGTTLKTTGGNDVAGGRRDVRLVIVSAASIAGRVLDDRGRPVIGARVRARSAAGVSLADCVADVDGRFQWTGVDGGTWSVEAADAETGRAEVSGIAPGDAEATLVLRAEPVVGGRVVGQDGKPLRGATVALAADDGREVARLRTDSEGRFSTKSLPSGSYTVRVIERDGAALEAPTVAGTVRSGAAEAVLRI